MTLTFFSMPDFIDFPRGGPFSSGPDRMFDTLFMLFIFVFVVVFIAVIGSFIRGGVHYAKQKSLPVTEVRSKVIAKRSHVGRYGGSNDSAPRTYTNYYITFETDYGKRMEFEVPQERYGYMVEGDQGVLKHQGTLFNAFERIGEFGDCDVA